MFSAFSVFITFIANSADPVEIPLCNHISSGSSLVAKVPVCRYPK